jgi:hypothetical protein
MKYRIHCTLNVPDFTPTLEQVKSFVNEALSSWGGSLEPPREENGWKGDPLFGPNKVTNITVRSHER